MMTAEQLCQRYASLAAEIRRATKFLRENRCPEESRAEYGPMGGIITPACQSCLDEFFTAPKGPDGEFPRHKEFFDKLCDICRTKLAVIDQRRECRQMLGAVKRAIQRVGEKLTAQTSHKVE